MRGGLLAALLCVALSAGWPVGAGASEGDTGRTTALVVFLAAGPLHRGQSEDDAIEAELGSVPTLSTGIVSATQGTYKSAQMLLDITQGARVSYSAYKPTYPPILSSLVLGRTGAHIPEWSAALRRADNAPQLLDPGLLATSIAGGGGYAAPFSLPGRESDRTAEVSVTERVPVSQLPAADGSLTVRVQRHPVSWPLVADRAGKIAAVSFGAPSTLLARISKLQAGHRLVAADLPSGAPGLADLRALAATREPGELLVVIQSPPDVPGHELLWGAIAGLPSSRGTGDSGGATLTSQSTNQRGMIAAIDIGPTILEHLGLQVPADMRGKPVRLDGAFEAGSLRALKARLVVIDSRRLPALEWLMLTWALLLTAVRLPIGRGDRQKRSAWAIRCGAIAMLWAPVAVLVPATLEPSRTIEFASIVATCFLLGALTDRLMPWPRAPLAPAVGAVLALTVDALASTQLLMRSLLGPSPAFGARFYGIGNELKSGLAVIVFCAVAAALYPAVRSRRTAAAMAGTGVVLAIVEGSARIGAGVGGVILVSAGTAVATVMMLPGKLDRKRVLIVMAAPIIGLAALAAIDLATAHGSGHFTGSVLDARSPGDIRDIVVRRYSAAWDELKNHLMPLATALALIASVLAVRRRDRVLAPVASDPAWLAALAGGLTSGVIGALTEDSGPVLLVVAVFALSCVLSYLWASPAIELARSPHLAPGDMEATVKQSSPVAFE